MEADAPKRFKQLLVIECQSNLNWFQVFDGAYFMDGDEKVGIKVDQAEWDDLVVTSYDDKSVQVKLRGREKNAHSPVQAQDRSVTVNFVLLRSVTHGINGQDSRNKLFALIHGNVPSVNSLSSAYMFLERPIMFGALRGIQTRLGRDAFPVIPQTLYSSHLDMLITPDFPLVAKVGHAHAGYGKMRFHNNQDFADFRGMIALHGDYVTAEPFVEWDWDGRIQKIGSHYRAFKRTSTNWKGNVGNQSIDMAMNNTFKMWVDECAKLFGGLDIIGLDFVHSKKEDKFVILELNDTAIGLVHAHCKEDMGFMRDVVVMRMEEVLSKNKASAAPASVPADSAALKEEVLQLQLQVTRLQDTLKKEKAGREADKEKKGFFGLL